MLSLLKENNFFKQFISWLGLFSSFGTLLCCALPSALVLLGFGATLANILGYFPQLVWLSEHKGYVFGMSFFMLGLSYLGTAFSKNTSCPIDERRSCENARRWSKPLFWVSLSINIVGTLYAFVVPLFF